MMKRLTRNSRGVGLTETLLSMTILLFASFASISLLTSNSAKSTLLMQRTKIASQLDDRVNEFLISDNFDDSDLDGTSFAQQEASGSSLRTYTATDSVSGLTISNDVFV